MNRRPLKVWTLLAARVTAGACAFAGESISVKQHDVTWTFDRPVQTGQFINGDWWVAPVHGQDSVTVVSVDPAPAKTAEGKLINGSMVKIDWFIGFGGVHSDYEAPYGREKTSQVGTAGLLLCLDKKVVGDKDPLLIGFVQTGIDLYGMLNSGCRWTSDGGWNMGRKFPILFAGLMLDDQEMLNIGRKYAPGTNTFQEDADAFMVTQADVGRKLDCMVGGLVEASSRDTINIVADFPAYKWKKGGNPWFTGNHIKIMDGPGAGTGSIYHQVRR